MCQFLFSLHLYLRQSLYSTGKTCRHHSPWFQVCRCPRNVLTSVSFMAVFTHHPYISRMGLYVYTMSIHAAFTVYLSVSLRVMHRAKACNEIVANSFPFDEKKARICCQPWQRQYIIYNESLFSSGIVRQYRHRSHMMTISLAPSRNDACAHTEWAVYSTARHALTSTL